MKPGYEKKKKKLLLGERGRKKKNTISALKHCMITDW